MYNSWIERIIHGLHLEPRYQPQVTQGTANLSHLADDIVYAQRNSHIMTIPKQSKAC